MELFKFTTVKPPAETVWKTLVDADIQPQEGISADIIRFCMYVILQTSKDFVQAKKTIVKPGIVMLAANILNVLPSSITSLQMPKLGYPNWVSEALYIPYYIIKQLYTRASTGQHKVMFHALFDRPTPSDAEYDHIVADVAFSVQDSYKGLTTWMLDNVPIDFYFQHAVKIDPNAEMYPIASKEDMITYIKDVLRNAIEETPDSILHRGYKGKCISGFVYTPIKEIEVREWLKYV